MSYQVQLDDLPDKGHLLIGFDPFGHHRHTEIMRQHKRVANKRPTRHRTLEEIERESILQALRESNWVVGGPGGAAAKLELKRTTLASRMESLGISRSGQYRRNTK